MKKCPECGSERIISNAKPDIYNSAKLKITVEEKPEALLFKQRIETDIRAEVCGDCGYISFYASNPQLLWTAYQNQRNNVS